MASALRFLGLTATVASLAGCQVASIEPEPNHKQTTRIEGAKTQVKPPEQVKATASAVASAPKKAAPLRVSNVLLITVDTLRADQPWMGYDGAKTPVLDGLVKRSVLFERAYSVANTTMPSLSALMMAKYPTELQRDDCGLPAFWGSETLAETMTKGGFHTAGFHGHPIFAGAFAPSKGFTEWQLVKDSLGRKATGGAVTGEEIAALAVDFLGKNPRDRRFFAWAHFVDPHDSYIRHRDFPPGPSPRRGLYDGEVSYTDAQIGKVLAALEQGKWGDSTAVIVAADHGEAFGEHDRYRHGHTLYEEEVRVPLILHIPGQAPRRIKEPRSLLDVARTITELTRVPPASEWRGVSLLRDLEGAPVARPVLVDAPTLTTITGQRAMIRGNEKLIWRGNSAFRFDLAQDSKEQRPETMSSVAPAWTEMQRLFQAIPSIQAKPCYRGG